MRKKRKVINSPLNKLLGIRVKYVFMYSSAVVKE